MSEPTKLEQIRDWLSGSTGLDQNGRVERELADPESPSVRFLSRFADSPRPTPKAAAPALDTVRKDAGHRRQALIYISATAASVVIAVGAAMISALSNLSSELGSLQRQHDKAVITIADLTLQFRQATAQLGALQKSYDETAATLSSESSTQKKVLVGKASGHLESMGPSSGGAHLTRAIRPLRSRLEHPRGRISSD